MVESISPRARIDIDEITTYTIIKWGESQAATYRNEIRDHLMMLGEFPHIGVEFQLRGRMLRKTPVGEHNIIYRVLENKNVRILRVLRRKRTLPVGFVQE